MKQLSIGQRLALAFGLLLAILAAVALLSLARLADLNQKIELVVRDRYPKATLSSRAFEGIQEVSIHLRNLSIVTGPAGIRQERQALETAEAGVGAILAELSSRITADKGRKLVAGLIAARRSYEDERAIYLGLLANGERERASALLLGQLSSDLAAYGQLAAQLSKIGGTLMNQSAEEAAQVYHDSLLAISCMALAALLLAATLSYRIGRGITLPLQRAVGAAETIARGDLAGDIESVHSDETGRLLRALKTMNGSLAAIVVEVRANAEAIAGSAAEIARGTGDLSVRTEQQASSLEETASAMEELTGTVRQGAGNARDALDVARNAAAVAERSSSEVRQILERMAAIEDSSHRIRDIIGVIDGIAFQTNILALNAAVEAARAGEMGRGFAVVASEVRNLAQRSAGAAHEIKTLIEDSVGRVAAGSEHARQAGSTMDAVLVEIRRVAVLMQDIEAASREQTAGIDQINQAVAQMDRVTQQNAALVEEAAAAAEDMHRRTETMHASVGVFILEQGRDPVSALAH